MSYSTNKNSSWIWFSYLCNKIWFKGVTSIYTSKSAKKIDLVRLKSQVDKMHVNKLQTVPTDLSKLSNVVKNDVVKINMMMMNWLKKWFYWLKQKKIEYVNNKIPGTSKFIIIQGFNILT